ncbi:MAG: hypothetical protein KDA44_16290 [Planctomycetales bacterium]|nr:hypothetical protein [Planctomycetales bacterium]
MTRLFLAPTLFMVLIVGSPAVSFSQTEVLWRQPVDGLWTDAAAWSPNVVPHNGQIPSGEYHARVDAQGADYEVTINDYIWLDKITLGSDDATLRLVSGGELRALDGISVNAGSLLLQSGNLYATRVEGPAGAFTVNDPFGRDLILGNVTLATTLRRGVTSANNVTLSGGGLILDGGVVELTEDLGIKVVWPTRIVGNGLLVVRRHGPACCEPEARITLRDSSSSVEIGSGVIVRAEQGGRLLLTKQYYASGGGSINNLGLMEVDGPDSLLVVDQYVAFSSSGTLRATNGGAMAINRFGPGGTVGNLVIDPGSSISLSSFDFDESLQYGYRFNQPVTISAGGELSIDGWWNAAGTTMTVDGGTLRVRGNTPTTGNWIWRNGPTLLLDGEMLASNLAQFATTPDTQISFDNTGLGPTPHIVLDQQPWNLNDIPGTWNLTHARFAEGSLVGLPNGNTIAANDSVYLNDVRLAVATTVGGGGLYLDAASELDAPLTVSGGYVDLQGQVNANVAISAGTLAIRSLAGSAGEIAVSGGTLSLSAAPTTPQQIKMTGGSLFTKFSTTLSTLRGFGWQPDEVFVGGDIDLEGSSLEPADDAWTWRMAGFGGFENGSLTDSQGSGWHFLGGVLRDVAIRADADTNSHVDLEGTVTIDHARLSGEWQVATATDLTLQGAVIDGDLVMDWSSASLAPVAVVDGLEVNGTVRLLTRRLSLSGEQSISGTGVMTTYGSATAPGGGLEASGNLTLGAGFTFHSEGLGSTLIAGGNTIVNAGTISAGIPRRGGRVITSAAVLNLSVQSSSLLQYGRLEVAAGNLVEADVLQVVNDGSLALLGGALTVHGDLTLLPASMVQFEIGGNHAGFDYGQLTVVGQIQLDGELAVSLADGFVPAYGQEFLIITSANPLAGDFGLTTLPPISANLQWIIEQRDTGVALRIDFSPLAVDYDQDGRVTGADLRTWQGDFGRSAGSDHDSNGVSNGADFLAWQRFYSAPSLEQLPEPGSAFMALAAMCLVWQYSRRRLWR